MSRRTGFSAARIVAAAMLLATLPLGAADGPKDKFRPQQRKYWAFQKVVRSPEPQVREKSWVRNPIDSFILAKLEAKGIRPGEQADRVTLLRRLTFDLTGLPPTPDETSAFVQDTAADAYDKVVDRLLSSPRYGERWARHWLDLARYAESEGFKADEFRPNVWRYRDYVVKSFNDDKPYDRFVMEQLAGDEMWPTDADAKVATGFNRHYPDESNARNLVQRRQEILNDITDTVGSVFLGMTFGCARCHDHKFDPILHADYYRLQSFFANIGAADDLNLTPTEQLAGYRAKLAAWEEKTKDIRAQIQVLLEPARKKIADDLFAKYPPEIQAAITKAGAERSPMEWLMAYKAKPYMNPDEADLAGALRGPAREKYSSLKKELAKFNDLYPGEAPTGAGIRDLNRTAPPTHILAAGSYERPLDEVQPGFLTIIDPNPAKIVPPKSLASTGRRTALAKWIASPENPLAGRVMVNRLWHHHFGAGLVGNPSDFGVMGLGPSHPELLDWLADEFVRSSWSIKKMHRLMVTSSAYRQSSAYREDAAKADSNNRLLWHFPRQRLEGEVIRDSSLFISGLLNLKMGGPGVYPPLPPGMTTGRAKWGASPSDDQNRRSVYISVRRNLRYPMLEVLDMPDTHESCARRDSTISAPQALTYLNSELVLDWAQSFAGRVLKNAGADVPRQIEEAYRLAYSRPPNGSEKDTAQTFFARHKNILTERVAANEKLALPPGIPSDVSREQAAALVDFCHMLLNSNEMVYRN
ncbi:MAG TPA: DUF1549 and DUF1553 domain-containing protein [Bryobacteraceae bacterium]|nr:DUF1549 and DUF1553 domain-containing protein [Bryobacteraceae bacterium]